MSNTQIIIKDEVIVNGVSHVGHTLQNGRFKSKRSTISVSRKLVNNRSLLRISMLIMHELVHADIIRIINSNDNQISRDEKVIKETFQEIGGARSFSAVEQALDNIVQIDSNIEDLGRVRSQAHHIVLAKFYLNKMAETLKDLHHNNQDDFGVINNQNRALFNNLDTYKALIVNNTGLQDGNVFLNSPDLNGVREKLRKHNLIIKYLKK